MEKYTVKTTDKKTILVEGKLIKKPAASKAPAWFSSFEVSLSKRFDNIDNRLDGIETRLDGVEKRLDGVEKRLDNIVVKNKLKE